MVERTAVGKLRWRPSWIHPGATFRQPGEPGLLDSDPVNQRAID
jgi:hypothetical protein